MASSLTERMKPDDAAYVREVRGALPEAAQQKLDAALVNMEEMLATATIPQNLGPFFQRYQRDIKTALGGSENASSTLTRLTAITNSLLPAEARQSMGKH